MFWKRRVSSLNASRSPCFACRVSPSRSIAPPFTSRCQQGGPSFDLSHLARGGLAKHVGHFLGGEAQLREKVARLAAEGAPGGGVPEPGLIHLDRVGRH